MIGFEVNQQAGKKISSKIWQQWLEKIARILKINKKLEISIAIVGEAVIKKLNKAHLGKNQVTDVLSFGEGDSKFKSGDGYLGEIIICYPQAARQAKRVKHSTNKELELLLIHGFLHLLGYDHEKPKENKMMRELEQKIMDYGTHNT